jgi:hypothetical protein|tara:strand:+ start:471 stop:641 length:171 start_codon:yes stop_codon:yes gene_type:complete
MLDIIIGILVLILFTVALSGAYLLARDKQRAYDIEKNSLNLHKRMQENIDDTTSNS